MKLSTQDLVRAGQDKKGKSHEKRTLIFFLANSVVPTGEKRKNITERQGGELIASRPHFIFSKRHSPLSGKKNYCLITAKLLSNVH
ncbi:hypothetical protein COU00_03080 [Candidatus Falkowbacteria bacterium CG10_big_fil_rev_8_21_14_0_10_43_11]|uniref:Uncharacterized protein n=1 Tax=Candidatus Falkowbacteria bacterium CG10_big_fil_rev_8_21_14_0_10_43_11 TaxID=1974568 RepID=A0A2M6WLN4_9BACT|nr:MAG: hypothetical protein COU00_03080 [Candidatus Falkowbacteria bacterium CG10_big_fil_rev_8_21_14_0_10_43_11]